MHVSCYEASSLTPLDGLIKIKIEHSRQIVEHEGTAS